MTFVEATLSDATKALPRPESINVDLELTLDASGKVTDAHVPVPFGDGYGEAAPGRDRHGSRFLKPSFARVIEASTSSAHCGRRLGRGAL